MVSRERVEAVLDAPEAECEALGLERGSPGYAPSELASQALATDPGW